MLTIKKGDTRNAIKAELSKNGEPMDLTDCEVLISISDKLYRFKCMVKDGTVVCPLNDNITNETGIFLYEFVVVHPDGREETVPNDEYFKLKIMNEIDNAQ